MTKILKNLEIKMHIRNTKWGDALMSGISNLSMSLSFSKRKHQRSCTAKFWVKIKASLENFHKLVLLLNQLKIFHWKEWIKLVFS